MWFLQVYLYLIIFTPFPVNIDKGVKNLCNHVSRGKKFFSRNFTFYFSSSTDYEKLNIFSYTVIVILKAFQKYRLIYVTIKYTIHMNWFSKKIFVKKKKRGILRFTPKSFFSFQPNPDSNNSYSFSFVHSHNPSKSQTMICVCNPAHLFCLPLIASWVSQLLYKEL